MVKVNMIIIENEQIVKYTYKSSNILIVLCVCCGVQLESRKKNKIILISMFLLGC